VLDTLAGWQADGTLRRFGVVVKHRELGYRANAMCVWAVPEAEVSRLGHLLASHDGVSLCYRRRLDGDWPYNLFCMIHGRNREAVAARREALAAEVGLAAFPTRCCSPPTATSSAAPATRPRCRPPPATPPSPHERPQPPPLDELDRRIINALQGGFPISDEPYREVADSLGTTEAELLARLQRMLDTKVLTRFGPMFQIERLGGRFVLAALAVPEARFAEVTALVNALPEVAHNYRREHALNMWFVLATETPEGIAQAIARIEAATGLPVFAFPKLREFFVDMRLKA
jgi:DNA-binding Lrp family transcriptional regulator